MADVRRISVSLSASLGNYATTMAKAAAATKALNDELETLESRSKVSLSGATEAEKEFDTQSDETTAKVKKNNQDQGNSSSALSRLLQMNTEHDVTAYQQLSKTIDDQKAKIEDLHSQANSGSGNGVQIFGDLKKAKSDLKELESFAEDMAPGFAKAGEDAGNQFTSQFGSAFGKAKGFIIPALIGGVIAAAPVLISIIGAALETGIGAGGIALGIYEAAKNPLVKSAAHQLGSTFSSELSKASGVFVGPTLTAISIIESHLAGIGPGLKSTFGELAKDVEPLAVGLGGAIDKFLPGLESGLKGATPLILELANDLPKLGKQIGDMFDKLGKGGAGSIMALRGLIGLVGDLLTGFGSLYDWSTRTFESLDQEIVHVANGIGDLLIALGSVPGGGKFTQMGLNVKQFADEQQNLIDTSKAAAAAQGELGGVIQTNGASAKAAAPDYAALSTQISQVQVTSDTLAGQMTDKLVGAMLNSDNASNNFNKSLITLGDTLVANGGKLDAHVKALKKTETGAQQNKDAILAVIQANLQEYDSQIAVGVSADDAAKSYDSNTKALRDQLKASGDLTPSVQKLIDKYAKVPDNVNTAIATEGLTDAITNLDTMLGLIFHIPPKQTTTFTDPGLSTSIESVGTLHDVIDKLPPQHTTDFNDPNLPTSIESVGKLHGLLSDLQTKHTTDFSNPGLPGSIESVGHLHDLLSNLPKSKSVNVTVKVSSQQLSKIDNELHRATGGIAIHNAAGGLYTHAADGVLSSADIYSAASPARYAYAEPSTGGEGFVPRYGNYGRSTSIIDQEAKWYGGRFVPNGGAGGFGAPMSSTYAPTFNVYPQRADFTMQDWNTLQAQSDAYYRIGRKH